MVEPKIPYLLNSFIFLLRPLEKHLGAFFEFQAAPPFANATHPPRSTGVYALRNFIHVKSHRFDRTRQPSIVHLNRPEALLAHTPIKRQRTIFEIHGFDIGVCTDRWAETQRDTRKREIGRRIGRILEPAIIRKVQNVDLFYVSTPNLIEPIRAWSGRQPIWLPNPIDTSIFNPDGPREMLRGSPACLLAARLHGDKKPETAIELFETHILPQFPDAVLHLIEQGGLVESYKKRFANNLHIEWHPYMDAPTLAAHMRGSDLIFGDFALGMLPLLPIQAMACNVPIVTLDRFETLAPFADRLPELALRLLEDTAFRHRQIESNHTYIQRTHAVTAFCQTHADQLRRFPEFSHLPSTIS